MTLKTANTPISRRTIKQADAEAASLSEVFMRFDIIEFDRSYGTSAQLKRFAEPEIVFSGRSNVGKSSLINKLFNRKNLARVSSVPGKTVTVNFFKGDKVNFVDLPGYGYAKAAKSEKLRWAELFRLRAQYNARRSAYRLASQAEQG